jgi:retron-type reverse transcriptase
MVRHSLNASELWENQDWKKFHQDLFRLQRRVFKAVQVGDKRKAQSLQKLIFKSQAARFLAIQQVTQLNTGKKTAGIDGQKSLTFEERFELEEKLAKNHANWKHKSLREIPIPKKDGTIRMLKVPTIADRAWQCLAKYALEPACALQLSTPEATGLEQDGQHTMPRKLYSTTSAAKPMEKINE